MSSTTVVTQKRGGFQRSFWFSLLLICILCAILYVLFFASLGILTKHGDDIKVPSVIGKDVKTAVGMLQSMGFDVEVDSTYEPEQKALLVLRQSPDVNEIVKHGRTLFITVNKAEPPMTPMPNLAGFTFRSAVMILKSNRLVLGDTTYRPDIGQDNILEVTFKGVPIRPGMLIPQGSRISFVLGDGLGNQVSNVPDVTGMTLPEAEAMLSGNGYQPLPIGPDVTKGEAPVTDSTTAIVFWQSPNPTNELGAPNNIRQGDFVDIHFKQTATPEEIDSIKKAGRVTPPVQKPDAPDTTHQ